MAIVTRSNENRTKGRVDKKKAKAATEAQKKRWDVEDGVIEANLGTERLVVPRTDLRALRERLGLSQEGFSERFMLSLRTVQEWEQQRREPSEPARVLLFAISNAPKAMEKALRQR